MKSAQELYEEWTSGDENGMRAERVQVLRRDISEATGLSPPHRIGEIRPWLERLRSSGTLTRKLKEAAGEMEAEDSDNGDS